MISKERFCLQDNICYHPHTRDVPALSSISKWLHREEGSEKVKKFSDFIKKSAEPQKKEPASNVIKGRFKIAKSDDDKHLAFGWANVAIRADGEEIEDWQEDIIEPEELENAAYQYVLLYREGGEMHERGGAAVLVESVVFTEEKMQAMGTLAGSYDTGRCSDAADIPAGEAVRYQTSGTAWRKSILSFHL